MFGARNLRGAAGVQHDENAVLGSAARPGRAGLLAAKDGVAGAAVAGKAADVGSPAPGAATPRVKAFGAKQQRARGGLREIPQTPSASARPSGPGAARVQDQAPRTIRRRQGLFSPAVQKRTVAAVAAPEPALLLEPEYAPPTAAAPELDAADEFGFDLDLALVPLTQLSTAGLRVAELPPPNLALEELADLSAEPAPPAAPDALPIPLLACSTALLVANALHPTRIPQLKRKR
ncbi:hypothetical protein H4R18_002363 [Coemansia javaensis]|uniref:Uncharacterized protein n=1 Tax=Coemansia javaensis TaxID=2761396 RepID=A0A9W8HIL8_9FUNG|nr:hypothetical protein H4R18_002363 [Coemansia javaensis]